MPVDIKYLAKRGISSAQYKKIFTDPNPPPKIKKLIQLLADRARDGKTACLREYRTIAAIDIAYEASFNQTTPTLVNNILSQNLTVDETLKALSSWGLSEKTLFTDVTLDNGQKAKMLNPPVFYTILIPIVKAYVRAMTARIYNERDQSPLLPINPLKQTIPNQIRAQIATDINQTISSWYGYPAVMREGIEQALKYGVALAFTKEEWHCEKQVFEDDGNQPKTVTVKEGLRYNFPHPTRMSYDLMHPLTTINTDTGCEHFEHWYVTRYGDILDNKMFWNRKSIWYGTNWFQEPLAGNYFNEVYPCQFHFPNAPLTATRTREDKAAWYSTSDRDKAIFITSEDIKLVPADWGLGDYKYPVWHRFLIAGDDCVIWAEPRAYTPVWFMGCDYSPNDAKTSSLALECIPWQDTLGNVLSQMVITAKQNLANFIFYDNQMVDKEDINKILSSGNRMYTSMNMVGFDSLKHARAGLQVDKAFHPVQLGYHSIQEMLQMFTTTLNIMERVLQISAQDSGAAASHQQSKFELQQTGEASSNRVRFTASFIDDGIDAWKRQLFDAFSAYGDADITAEISAEIEELDKYLSELGFSITGRGKDNGGNERISVRGKKQSLRPLRYESFARSNEGPQKQIDPETAQILFQTAGIISGQPELFKKIGAKNVLSIIREGVILSGGRKDFKLTPLPEGETTDEVPMNIIEAIKQAQEATMQAVSEKIAQPAAQAVSEQASQIEKLDTALQQLSRIYALAEKQVDKTEIAARESAAQLERERVEFEAEERRKEEAHQLDMRRKQEAAIVDTAITGAKADASIDAKKREATASIASTKAKSGSEKK